MGKLTIGLVATLIAACATSQKTEPQILSIVPAIKQVENAVYEPDSYLVRLNFVLFADELVDGRVTTSAFQSALEEWTSHLPIECAVFIEHPKLFMFMPFGPDMISDQRGMIRVHIVDLTMPPYNMPDEMLGYWDWSTNKLVLNRARLEKDHSRAYAVALHELGHVFGLPHFLNVEYAAAQTGCYMIPRTYNAKYLVMFPYSTDSNKCSQLTELEISLARKNLLGIQQIGRTSCFSLTAH